MIVPPGTELDLLNHSVILSFSPVFFRGTENFPITMFSSDNTGQGMAVIKTGPTTSRIDFTNFMGLSSPFKEGWELTGALTFYESPVEIRNTNLSSCTSEDSLNLVRTNFLLEGVVFSNSLFDSLDVDFGTGKILDTAFFNSGNDAVDFSGSLVNITNLRIFNASDKGVSVGERSRILVSSSEIDGSDICFASKDSSSLVLEKTEIKNCKYPVAVYQKKSEYGPSSFVADSVSEILKEEGIFEVGSEVKINGEIVVGNKKDVLNFLYPA